MWKYRNFQSPGGVINGLRSYGQDHSIKCKDLQIWKFYLHPHLTWANQPTIWIVNNKQPYRQRTHDRVMLEPQYHPCIGIDLLEYRLKVSLLKEKEKRKTQSRLK